MTAILQLSPPISVVTPLGDGCAVLVIDYGVHQNSCWVVSLLKDGQIKHFDANDVRLQTNWTYGIGTPKL